MLVDRLFCGTIDDNRRKALGDMGVANQAIAEAKATLIRGLIVNPVGSGKKFRIKIEVGEEDEEC